MKAHLRNKHPDKSPEIEKTVSEEFVSVFSDAIGKIIV